MLYFLLPKDKEKDILTQLETIPSNPKDDFNLHVLLLENVCT